MAQPQRSHAITSALLYWWKQLQVYPDSSRENIDSCLERKNVEEFAAVFQNHHNHLHCLYILSSEKKHSWMNPYVAFFFMIQPHFPKRIANKKKQLVSTYFALVAALTASHEECAIVFPFYRWKTKASSRPGGCPITSKEASEERATSRAPRFQSSCP